jgi:hypothetical protein
MPGDMPGISLQPAWGSHVFIVCQAAEGTLLHG